MARCGSRVVCYTRTAVLPLEQLSSGDSGLPPSMMTAFSAHHLLAEEDMVVLDLAKTLPWADFWGEEMILYKPYDERRLSKPYVRIVQNPGNPTIMGAHVSVIIPVDVTTTDTISVPVVILNRNNFTRLRVPCDFKQFETREKGPGGQWAISLSGPAVHLLVNAGDYFIAYDYWNEPPIGRTFDGPIHRTNDNEFILQNVPAGHKLLVVASRVSIHIPPTLWYHVIDAEEGSVELTLESVPMQIVTGRVYDRDNMPISNACVIAECAEPLGLFAGSPPRGHSLQVHDRTVWVNTAKDGSFQFRLGQGRYRLSEKESGRSKGVVVDVKPGVDRDIRLTVD